MRRGGLRLGWQPAEQAAVDRVALAVVEAHEQVAGLEVGAARGEILREEIHAPELLGVGLVGARHDHETVRVEGVTHGLGEHGAELVEGGRHVLRRVRGHVGEHLAVGVDREILEGQRPGILGVLRRQFGGHRDHLPVAHDVARLREPAAGVLRAGEGCGQQKESGATKRPEAEKVLQGTGRHFSRWRFSAARGEEGRTGRAGMPDRRALYGL